MNSLINLLELAVIVASSVYLIYATIKAAVRNGISEAVVSIATITMLSQSGESKDEEQD